METLRAAVDFAIGEAGWPVARVEYLMWWAELLRHVQTLRPYYREPTDCVNCGYAHSGGCA